MSFVVGLVVPMPKLPLPVKLKAFGVDDDIREKKLLDGVSIILKS